MNIYTKVKTRQEGIPRLHLSGKRLICWLGLNQVARRSWSARLPCVLGASVILSVLLFAIGIRSEDLYFVLILPLFSTPFVVVLVKKD